MFAEVVGSERNFAFALRPVQSAAAAADPVTGKAVVPASEVGPALARAGASEA